MGKLNRIRLRAARPGAGCGIVGLLLMLAVVAGCTTVRKSKPEAAVAEPVVTTGSGGAVTRLPEGREGFVISEQTELGAKERAAFDQAVVLLKGGHFAEAITVLEPIVASSPGVTAPYIDLAIACRHEGKSKQAETCLKQALELVPGHPVASNEYGLLLRQAGHFDEARTVYEQAMAEFPEYLPLHRNLGILCELYLDDQACALEQYRIYSDGRPEDEVVQLWIADLNLRMGKR